MKLGFYPLFFLLTSILFPSTFQAKNQSAQSVVSNVTEQQVEEILALHNKARKQVGVPPLKWSNTLAAFAQEWADHLAESGCKMQHRPRSGKWKQQYGENLFMATVGHYDVKDAINAWESEKQYFKERVTRSNFNKVGHYTQMVWKSTTHVGCGIATCGNFIIIVCNYDPPGNMLGEKPY